MALFDIPSRPGREFDSSIAKKSNTKSKKAPTTVKGGGGLMEKISIIKANVEKNLGHLKDKYDIIYDGIQLNDYINACIEVGEVAIDTETTGLNPILDKLAGISMHTPGRKAVYIPINHISYITGMRVDEQMTEEQVRPFFQKLADAKIDIDMFNAPFDIRVIKNQIGVRLKCTWDCYLGARLLNENEPTNQLKPLHNKYCLDGKGDAFTFDDLFKGITFDYIPIKVGYIYAAHDAEITYELKKFQEPYLTPDNQVCIDNGLVDVANVFHNIEMPIVDVCVDMEDTGVKFDFEYNAKLKEKYHTLLEEREQNFHELVDKLYSNEVADYRKKMGINCKLDDPINIGSPAQLAILLFDIMGCPLYFDKKKKQETRSTSEDSLVRLDNPISKAILDYREFSTIVTTFIDKLPECVNPKDGRIHCKFNQYGADTGRFSSQDPNLQNIPSHNTDIRKMFVASDGYVLMSSDFSQQEPKALAAMCAKAGDRQMLDTVLAGKDLYAEIASKAFNYPYEECKEFRPDGTTNKAGKERRSQAKTILLGVLYGRGVDSIAEQIGKSKQEAQAIKDSVFNGFPAIAKFEKDSIKMAEDIGYVTTVCGRKRRLPSMMLPDYDVKYMESNDDILDFDSEASTEVPDDVWYKWVTRINNTPFKQRQKVFKAANAEGLWIIDNTKDKDVTKVVNARIQGSAADLTKVAMIDLHNNARLKELGFRLLIPVHDEVIAECPEENAKECSELLAQIMSHAAEEILMMPINCDVEVTKCWYGERVEL